MTTLTLRRLSWIVPLLAGTLAAHAQDLHIKKNITVGGYGVSSTETSIKGARERTVSQSPTGTAALFARRPVFGPAGGSVNKGDDFNSLAGHGHNRPV